jgi:hypothetical protein
LVVTINFFRITNENSYHLNNDSTQKRIVFLVKFWVEEYFFDFFQDEILLENLKLFFAKQIGNSLYPEICNWEYPLLALVNDQV